MYRYLAVIWNELSQSQIAAARRVLERIPEKLPDMQQVASGTGFVVLAARIRSGTFEAYPLTSEQGVVVGKLFHRDVEEETIPRQVVLDRTASEAIATSQGQSLIDDYWGRYVAFIYHRPTATMNVIRDPSGAIPCLFSGYQGTQIVFSYAEDWASLGLMRFSINWQHVYTCLVCTQSQAPATGLNEIVQVRQGEGIALRSNGSMERALRWNPMQICESNPIEDPGAAVDAVRRMTKACIGAWASCYPRILLRYSGGFDSTVVLCCLRQAASHSTITCLNYFDPPADEGEREYLHRALRGTSKTRESVEFLEIARSPASIRLDSLRKVKRFAIPSYYKALLMEEPHDNSLADERGAALFDGVYGDQLFLTDRGLTDVDYLWRHPLWKDALNGPVQGKQLEEILWTAFSSALRSGLFESKRPTHSPSQYPYIKASVLAALDSDTEDHRPYWLQQPSYGVPPGKLRHIGWMCIPSDMNYPCNPSDPERVSPLFSQPLMELFLRVPTYVLNTGELDRTAVRQAFSEYLPKELLSQSMVDVGRQVHFNANHLTVFRQNEGIMREMLLDGVLVREGLLDRDAIERHLSDCLLEGTFGDVDVLETYFDLELWLQSWKSSLQSSASEL